MTDSKRSGAGSPDEHADNGTPATTIVGARPPGRGQPQQGIPRGIEVLIKKASVDAEFRALLLERRAEAAAEINLDLSPAEAATLNAVPRAQIEKIIENAKVPDEHRRVFLGKIGAAMLALLGLGLPGCDSANPPPIRVGGILSDAPPKAELVPVRVSADNERLKVEVIKEESNSAIVLVKYMCPFESAILMVFLLNQSRKNPTSIKSRPRSFHITRGEGEVKIEVYGKGEQTGWIAAGLLSGLGGSFPHFSGTILDQPGEYLLGDGAIWRIAEFKKEWPA